jgi:ribulose-phosphate 3-epimerase
MRGIYPSVLSADFSELRKQIKIVETENVAGIHCDIMDGHFVPNISFGPMIVETINHITDLPLDVHLMIENSQKYIPDFVKAGADLISVHYENNMHLNRVVNLIKDSGKKAGVVLNPSTPVSCLTEIIPYLDYVLIMSVNPGFGGQRVIRGCFSKIPQLQRMIAETGSTCKIEIDGGVDLSNIKELKDLGVDMYVAGASIFKSGNIIDTIKHMNELIRD